MSETAGDHTPKSDCTGERVFNSEHTYPNRGEVGYTYGSGRAGPVLVVTTSGHGRNNAPVGARLGLDAPGWHATSSAAHQPWTAPDGKFVL